jgi:hypothetical protein
MERLLEQLEGDRCDQRTGGEGQKARGDLSRRRPPCPDPGTDGQGAGGDDGVEDGLIDRSTLAAPLHSAVHPQYAPFQSGFGGLGRA